QPRAGREEVGRVGGVFGLETRPGYPPSASLPYWTHFAISASHVEPGGTGYSNSTGRNRPLVLLQHLQHVLDRRVSLSPGHVLGLIVSGTLAVLQVHAEDAGMVLSDERTRAD